jgi:hypothetical protein
VENILVILGVIVLFGFVATIAFLGKMAHELAAIGKIAQELAAIRHMIEVEQRNEARTSRAA